MIQSVKIIYTPPRQRDRDPKPPAWWRTFWRRTGTVVEYLGVRWELVVVGAADQMWRQWVGTRQHGAYLYRNQQYANVDSTNQNQNQKEDSHG